MQTNSLFLILAAIVSGAVVPFQAGPNAILGRTLGHPLWGTLISLCVSLACILPGNANPNASLAPYVKKAGVTCDIENARAIGSGAKNSYFEVACKGGAGYVIQTVSPMNVNGEVTVNSCLLYEEGGNVSCKLTNRQTQLAVLDTLNTAAAAAGTKCDIKDKRYILSTKNDNYYEVACTDGKGYVYQ